MFCKFVKFHLIISVYNLLKSNEIFKTEVTEQNVPRNI